MDGIERAARWIGVLGAGRAACWVPTCFRFVLKFPDSPYPTVPASLDSETPISSKEETP